MPSPILLLILFLSDTSTTSHACNSSQPRQNLVIPSTGGAGTTTTATPAPPAESKTGAHPSIRDPSQISVVFDGEEPRHRGRASSPRRHTLPSPARCSLASHATTRARHAYPVIHSSPCYGMCSVMPAIDAVHETPKQREKRGRRRSRRHKGRGAESSLAGGCT
jgi:hypothetical protein